MSLVLIVFFGIIGAVAVLRALAANTPLTVDVGDIGSVGVLTSSVIYEGSMVGLSAGYGRALVAGDTFLGHAYEPATGNGTSGGVNCKLRRGTYNLVVTLGSVVVTDIGKSVYALDDGTYTLTATSNSLVGKVVRYVAANTCVVRFETIPGSAPATTALATITIADAAGTPDYALQALTVTSPYGLATAAEMISLLYVIQNLQLRVLALEART